MTVDTLAIEDPDERCGRARDWRDESVCRKHPTQWWFAGGHHETVQAKAICSGCGVRDSCLEFALSRPDLLGIWAATTPNERAALRRGSRASVPASGPGVAGPALGADVAASDRGGAAPGTASPALTPVCADAVLAVGDLRAGVEIDLVGPPAAVAAPGPDAKASSRRGPRRGMARTGGAAGHGDLLTPAEAARKLGVTPNTVTRWSRAGKISAIQTMGGHRRFRRSEIERVQREANLFAPASCADDDAPA